MRSTATTAIAVAATALLVVVTCIGSVEAGSTMYVSYPPSLAQQFQNIYPPIGDIPDAPAMFGIPFYTQTAYGVVRKSNPPLGCTSISTADWPDPGPGGSPVILMIDRGNCSFVSKVRNCQAAGAVACVIADTWGIPRTQRLPLMGDDGTGKTLTTPSMIIHQADAELIYAALANSTDGEVDLTLTFSLPNPDGSVQWELWTSSHDPASSVFKHTFDAAAVLLDSSHTFIPRYLILDGTWPQYNCFHTGRCGKQCTNGGRYCAVDPELNLRYGKDGEDVVMENLRQMCVYSYLNATGQGVLWWSYVQQFEDICAPSDATWNATCSNVILKALGIDIDAITACVGAPPNGGFGDNTNDRINAELKHRSDEGIFTIPMLVVNDEIYYGSMNCPMPLQFSSCGPLQAICAGFAPGTAPAACTGDSGCAIGVKRDECGVCGGTGRIDACGVCQPPNVPSWNQGCAGCDGVAYSNFTRDACGRCLGPKDPTRITNPNDCLAPNGGGATNGTTIINNNEDNSGKGVGIGIVIAVAVAGLAVMAIAGLCYIRRFRSQTQRDVTALLRQYVPLDVADAKTVERMRIEKAAPLSGQAIGEGAAAAGGGDATGAPSKVERAQLLTTEEDSQANSRGPPSAVDEL